MKRLFDITVSGIFIVLISPLLLILGWLIRRHDDGPALFRQTRVGFHGEHFELLKFRSMVLNASELGGISTQDNDPRITTVGQFLRKSSLDELPQLVNVLRGDMSLVGPRPAVPAQRDLYNEERFQKRCSVRPGITGLAQAIGRSDCVFEEQVRMDLDYVDRAGFFFDCWILLLTAKKVLGKGAN